MPSQTEINAAKTRIMESGLSEMEKAKNLRALDEIAQPSEVELEMPEQAKDIIDLSKRLEKDLQTLEEQRPEHKKLIKEKRAEFFDVYKEILKTEPNPVIASTIAKTSIADYFGLKFAPLNEMYSQDDINTLYESVRSSTVDETVKLDLFGGLNKVFFEGEMPYPSEVKAFDRFFGTNIRKIVERNLPESKKAMKQIANVVGIPRAVLCSCDFSAGGRQGWLLGINHPVIAIKDVYKGYRAFLAPEYANLTELKRKTHPFYNLLVDSGIFESEVGGLNKAEEAFQSELAHRIPIIGDLVRRSEYAYVTTLNALRSDVFYHVAEKWQGTGKSRADYKALASYINHATGRGNLGKWFDEYGHLFNMVFFAPRLQVGRIQVLTDVLTSTSPVRQIVIGDLLEAFGIGMLILGLAAAAGAQVEHDPRSSDFGKVKVGNTRLDFMQGYSQMMRLVVQATWAERKDVVTDRVYDISRKKAIWNYIRLKFSPQASLAVDLWTGETVERKRIRFEPEFIAEDVGKRLAPLFLQDLYDSIRYQGLDGAALVGPLALHGVGAITYEPSAFQEERRIKNSEAQAMFGQKWDETSPIGQELLRQRNSLITVAEEKSRSEREVYTGVGELIQQEQDVGKKVQNSLSKEIRTVLEENNLRIGGFKRSIAQGWFLKDKKYKEYQTKTKELLEEYLGIIVKDPEFKYLNPMVQRAILEKVIAQCKETVRGEIVTAANLKDIQKLERY